MRLLVFSDIHGDVRALERLMESEADHYVAAGDLVTWSRGLDALGPVLQKKSAQVHVLPGNHESASQVERFCAKYGLDALHERWFEAGGWRVAGLGYSNPTPFNTPGEYTEEELAERLGAFSGMKRLILVCHCPPLETDLDRMGPGRHCGSAAVRRFIQDQQPEWFFCGHIHEAEGSETMIGGTRAVNVGKQGYLLDLGSTS